MRGLYDDGLGLMNQITAVPNANISYINAFPSVTAVDYTNSFIPKNYKLLKRNKYLKLV